MTPQPLDFLRFIILCAGLANGYLSLDGAPELQEVAHGCVE